MSGIGDRIKLKRKEKKITLDYLGQKVGTSKQTIQKYEAGIISNIPSDKIELLASALDVSPAYLMGWEEDKKEIAPKWGNHKTNIEYFSDKPELLNIYEDLVKRDEIAVLFDKTRELDPKDIETILLFVQTLRKQRGFDD